MAKPIIVETSDGTVELIMTDDGANNTFEKRRRFGGDKIVTRMKHYDVMFEGKKVGEVYQGRATFERKTPGRTYVNARWTNVRWFYELDNDPAFRLRYGTRRSTDYVTRKWATESLMNLRAYWLKEAAKADPALEYIDV